jgi:hypothetical protein
MTEFFTLPASNDAVPYSPKWLNALSDAEKQSVAMSDFSRSMHNSGGEHVAWLLWSTQEKAKPTPVCTENLNPDVVMVKPAEDRV